MGVSRFSGPIPGHSLTTPPKSQPWEKAPQFNNVDDAMDFIIRSTMKPKKIAKLVNLLKQGVPVEGLVRTILFAGFTEGKWSMDLMILLGETVSMLLAVIYKKHTGKDPKITFNEGQADPQLADIMKNGPSQEMLNGENALPEGPEEKEIPREGLMGLK